LITLDTEKLEMEQCRTKAEFEWFLSILKAPWEKLTDNVIVVYAEMADAFWIWDGYHFCLLQGGVQM